jgi:hypothetical protein
MPDPPLSVEDAHASDMVEVPVAVATRFVGCVGVVLSTATEAVSVLVPLLFVAVRV